MDAGTVSGSERLSRRTLLGMAGASTVVLASGALAGTASAGETTEAEDMRAGTIGLVRGQVARLSAVDHNHGTDPTAGIMPCGLEIRAIDGSVLASTVLKLGPGQGGFIDHAFGNQSVGTASERLEVYGVLRHAAGDHRHGGSLQVFMPSTGQTTGTIIPCGFVDPKFGQVPPDQGGSVETTGAGTIGLAPGQVARLVAVDHDHSGDPAGAIIPCGLEIRAIDGSVLASKVVKLGPSQGGYVDFAYSAGGIGSPGAKRLEVYGLLRHPAGVEHHHGGSLQVFNPSTGQTTGILVPCGFADPKFG